jgi:hypothetical protein
MTPNCSTSFSNAWAIFVLTTALLSTAVHGENRSYSGILTATPEYIHYSEGYLVVPGTVDLSGLLFSTSDDGFYEAKNRTDGLGDQGNRRNDVPVTDDEAPGRSLQRQLKESTMVRTRHRDAKFLYYMHLIQLFYRVNPSIFLLMFLIFGSTYRR